MIFLIHFKQPVLQKGFFVVIYVQIRMEAISNLSLLIMNIIYLTNITRGKWFITFPILFIFSYIGTIFYNIIILIYLMIVDKEREESIVYENDNNNNEENNSCEELVRSSDTDSKSITTKKSTLTLNKNSFKIFQFISLTASIIYTALYIIYLFINDNNIEDEEEWCWYYYFINGSKGYLRFAFFIVHLFFFFCSVPYLILSFNKEKISKNIFLKRYSFYCILGAFSGLLCPISLILFITIKPETTELFYLIILAFIIYMIITINFRLNCYYIQNILEYNIEIKNESLFWKKCVVFYEIIFRCKKIPQPNFVDLNSTFIYHSLANQDDFFLENNY